MSVDKAMHASGCRACIVPAHIQFVIVTELNTCLGGVDVRA
jgi:hypothetical protein